MEPTKPYDPLKAKFRDQLQRITRHRDGSATRQYIGISPESSLFYTHAGLKLKDIRCSSAVPAFAHCENLEALGKVMEHYFNDGEVTVTLTKEQMDIITACYQSSLETPPSRFRS
jgi:hypothetical protein